MWNWIQKYSDTHTQTQRTHTRLHYFDRNRKKKEWEEKQPNSVSVQSIKAITLMIKTYSVYCMANMKMVWSHLCVTLRSHDDSIKNLYDIYYLYTLALLLLLLLLFLLFLLLFEPYKQIQGTRRKENVIRNNNRLLYYITIYTARHCLMNTVKCKERKRARERVGQRRGVKGGKNTSKTKALN